MSHEEMKRINSAFREARESIEEASMKILAAQQKARRASKKDCASLISNWKSLARRISESLEQQAKKKPAR